MSGTPGDPPRPPAGTAAAPELPQADVRSGSQRGFQLIWLIPIVAVLVALWLGWQTLNSQGPQIVITFHTGDGITAGQTKVKHKAVDLGTVKSVSLSDDMNTVEVRVDMLAQADKTLTDSARFWVVRPRLTGASISGLDTVLSGSYIEMDPGVPSGRQTHFTGLEDPPAVRSGEPGTEFTLRADRIGSLGIGAPVFYRDVPAGEVLNYELGNTEREGVTLHVFVRKPFNGYVHPESHFWNASGVSVDLGAQGVQVRLESLQAALSGGIAFDTAPSVRSAAPSPPNATFTLYKDEAAARAAGFSKRIKLVTYFDGSVRGLAVGAPVELNGIQIGNVTDIKLLFDPVAATSRVAVHMEIQPERFEKPGQYKESDTLRVAEALVQRGLRAELATASFLTGQMLVSFQLVPGTQPEDVAREGDEIVIPGVAGGLDSLTSNLSLISQKLEALPLDQIARNLNDTLHGIAALVGGPEIRHTLQSVDAAASHLPAVARHIDTTLDAAGRLVGSANAGYGDGSQFRRDLTRLLDQASDTARSVRLLADYLNEHPEALIRGRTGQATGR